MTRNPRGPDAPYDPAEPQEKKGAPRWIVLCTDQYCARYVVGTRGKGEVNTGTNHLGFRCVVPLTAKSKLLTDNQLSSYVSVGKQKE